MFKFLKNLFGRGNGLKTKFVNYTPGPPQNMRIQQRQIEAKSGEQLLKIKAVGINRAECLHREGKYKITRPVQSFLGLQASGEVIDPQTNRKLYDGIALLTGGSYAQWASLPADHILPLPTNLNFVEGAAIPEAWITAFQLLRLADVKKGQNVVIYAGASGVGTAAIQLCKLLGANAWAVVSTPEKGKICQELGVKGVAYYKDNIDWVKDLKAKSKGSGDFNVVLDCIGPKNADSTVQLLGTDGKWILFGLLSGAKTNLNMASIIGKRISLISTTLKTRTDEYKADLVDDFRKTALQSFETGHLKPIIYKTLSCDWSSPQAFIQGHKLMQSNQNIGKIMIEFK